MLFSDLDLSKTYTYADYYSWTFEDRTELINGKVFHMGPTPNRQHQQYLGFILCNLGNYLDNKSWQVYPAPFDVRFPHTTNEDKDILTVLQPDVCVICDRTKLDDRGGIGAPDIVVEILSPGNNAKDLKHKRKVYEEAGVKEYWVVAPQNEVIYIHTLHDGHYRLSPPMVAGDVITSPLLPGFTLDLDKLFSSYIPTERYRLS